MKFLEVTFSRHGTCKLLYDTSLALARSSPTRRYTGSTVLALRQTVYGGRISPIIDLVITACCSTVFVPKCEETSRKISHMLRQWDLLFWTTVNSEI